MEFILDPKNERYTLFPIKDHEFWSAYKKAQAFNWSVEEIDFQKTIYEKLVDKATLEIESFIKKNEIDTKVQ